MVQHRKGPPTSVSNRERFFRDAVELHPRYTRVIRFEYVLEFPLQGLLHTLRSEDRHVFSTAEIERPDVIQAGYVVLVFMREHNRIEGIHPSP